MIDEDELDEVEEGLVDLAMRGWRTLDEHPLDPRRNEYNWSTTS